MWYSKFTAVGRYFTCVSKKRFFVVPPSPPNVPCPETVGREENTGRFSRVHGLIRRRGENPRFMRCVVKIHLHPQISIKFLRIDSTKEQKVCDVAHRLS